MFRNFAAFILTLKVGHFGHKCSDTKVDAMGKVLWSLFAFPHQNPHSLKSPQLYVLVQFRFSWISLALLLSLLLH